MAKKKIKKKSKKKTKKKLKKIINSVVAWHDLEPTDKEWDEVRNESYRMACEPVE